LPITFTYFSFLFLVWLFLLKKIDSLETVLQKHTKEDSTKVIFLNQLAWENRGNDFAKALRYISEGAKISKKIKYQRGLATGLSQKPLIISRTENKKFMLKRF